MKKRTIIATVGPSSMNKTIIKKMDEAGVDMFRINLSHTNVDDFESIVKKLQSWTLKPICPDTEGAQIRTSIDRKKIKVHTNDEIEFINQKCVNNYQIGINNFSVREIFQVGDVLKIDFDGVLINIIKIKNNVIGRVLEGGNIGNNKGIAIDRDIILPSFTDKDLEILKISNSLQLNHFFFSFCSNYEDIITLRKMFTYSINVISKIENKRGLYDLSKICNESDAILIDRGDLSMEVPLEKIPFIQSYIINHAHTLKTKVFVATNLMESMIVHSKPTRAEINDIRSTLNEGASGLVLAAESAVGKYPVECVRIMSRIIHEVDLHKKHDLKYLFSLPTDRIIEPHGGTLVLQHLNNSNILLPPEKLIVDENCFMDSLQIAEGTYSPIKGFMGIEELQSVLKRNKLLNEVPWTIPILLQIDEKTKSSITSKGDVLLLRKNENKPFAILKIKNIEKISNKKKIAKLWFDTDNDKHPGVLNFLSKGDYVINGEPYLLSTYKYSDKNKYELTPKQTREIFDHKNWHKIIGFHTRNVIHRGHEHIQIKSLDRYNADAIFISPVTGLKKSGDFSSNIILDCYNEIIKNNIYKPYGALLSSFNTYSRFSGPREAIFTAICRKNYGCSHFIVGRDHTGVGDYYHPTASQEIFNQFDDLGIEPIIINEIGYSKKLGKYINSNEHKYGEILNISGTDARNMLKQKVLPPNWFMRREISELIINNLANGEEVFIR